MYQEPNGARRRARTYGHEHCFRVVRHVKVGADELVVRRCDDHNIGAKYFPGCGMRKVDGKYVLEGGTEMVNVTTYHRYDETRESADRDGV